MKHLYLSLLFLVRFIIRCIVWLALVFIGALILGLLFDDLFRLETHSLNNFIAHLTVTNLIKFGGVILLSFLIEYVNELLDDKVMDKFSSVLTYLGMERFGSYVLFKYIEATSNVKILPINKLDEFVYKFYLDAQGAIHLFNPSADLITNTDDKVWRDIRKAIEDNQTNIDKIIFAVTQETAKDIGNVENIANKLKINQQKVELKILKEVNEMNLATFFRAATYLKENNIAYFLYRPICPPYKDCFVFTQPAKDIGNLQCLQRNQNVSLRAYIREFMNSL